MKKTIIALFATLGLMLTVSAPTAQAQSVFGDACKGAAANTTICKQSNSAQAETNTNAFIQNITNILFFVVGVLAVIMIIIGGLKYVTSNGDSGSITSAKNTILYSVIGLVVALLAYAIVSFVLNNV